MTCGPKKGPASNSSPWRPAGGTRPCGQRAAAEHHRGACSPCPRPQLRRLSSPSEGVALRAHRSSRDSTVRRTFRSAKTWGPRQPLDQRRGEHGSCKEEGTGEEGGKEESQQEVAEVPLEETAFGLLRSLRRRDASRTQSHRWRSSLGRGPGSTSVSRFATADLYLLGERAWYASWSRRFAPHQC